VDAIVVRGIVDSSNSLGMFFLQICPFFKTRSIIPDAEIVFVPYNYLIDPMARRSIGISLENAVLIFDEAHNVVRVVKVYTGYSPTSLFRHLITCAVTQESIASEAASYALTSTDIAGCVQEVDQFIRALMDHQVVLGPDSPLNVEVRCKCFAPSRVICVEPSDDYVCSTA